MLPNNSFKPTPALRRGLILTLGVMAKHLPTDPEELSGWTAQFFSTIKGESDRGCVLVAAAFLDEALELLLRSRMSTDSQVLKSSIEPLFTGIGPLKSFWAKTELCRALRLVPDYEYADLTRIRNLRNHFAHSYVNASFDDAKAVEIVSELRHFGLKEFPPKADESEESGHVRDRFSLAASWLAGAIHKRAGVAGVSGREDR